MPKPAFAPSLCVDATVNGLIDEAHKKYGISRFDAGIAAGNLINLSRLLGGNVHFEVAVQGGSAGFVSALKNFDSRRGIPFMAFAKTYLLGGITRALRAEAAIRAASDNEYENYAMPEDAPSNEPSPPQIAAAAEVSSMLCAFVSRLPERLRPVADGVLIKGEIRAQVARRLGLSRMAVTKAMQRITDIAAVDLQTVIHDAIAA